jgi:hypothetical protein
MAAGAEPAAAGALAARRFSALRRFAQNALRETLRKRKLADAARAMDQKRVR